LLPILDETLKNCPNVEIVYGDILDIDLNKLFKEKFETGDIKVVANLPYYVTTPIIAKLLEDDLDIHSIVVMVQKEVADRIVAGPGNKQYSSLSVFAQYYTNPEVILKVPKTVFMPRPKVDSAVVKLTLKRDNENIANKELFFKIVRAAFGKRRKTLLNALASGDLKVTKDELREILRNAEIDPKERAENLTVEDFIKISSIFPPLDIY
jgi:16S rRNA (adenine1518-N6/adenine1519-N6)-dimethyltransferase